MTQFAELFYRPWFLFIWGTCWGSFLNVVMYRYPRGLSIVYPGSACPKCNHHIAAWENIPILSWLFLGAKCRYCKAPISPAYVANEIGFGLLSAVPVAIYPDSAGLGLCLGSALLCLGPTLFLLLRHGRAPWYLWTAGVGFTLGYLFQILG